MSRAKINRLAVIDLDVLKANIFLFSVVKVDFSSLLLYSLLNSLIFFFLVVVHINIQVTTQSW